MENKQREYQLNCFFSPTLDQSQLDEEIAKIKKWLEEKGGQSKGEKNTRKNLAYSIKHFNDAYYLSLDFSLDPEKITNLEDKLKLEKNILRFLVIRQFKKREPVSKIKKELKIEKEIKTEPKTEETKPVKEEIVEEDKDKKVKLEELDKKLDEILSE